VGTTLSEVLEIANQLFPFDLAEDWDNCGIQIGNPSRQINSIAFSVDATPKTVKFAETHSCNLLITHHPVLLESIRSITPATLAGQTLLQAAASGVDILSLHTNLDAAPGGLNDYLTKNMNLESIIVPTPAKCARLGKLPAPMGIWEYARQLSQKLHLTNVRIISESDKNVQTVFCASGSGMGYLHEAIRYGADLIVTGDVRYHAAREALAMGIPIIDAGHYGLEKAAPEILLNAFKAEMQQLAAWTF